MFQFRRETKSKANVLVPSVLAARGTRIFSQEDFLPEKSVCSKGKYFVNAVFSLNCPSVRFPGPWR